ncbi:hypothetical protein J8N54_001653 [Salmonella enterica]|nr:hypothetical protein [Salmonella enterica]EHH5781169.1 hypothetical protein [Salmonella enterica]
MKTQTPFKHTAIAALTSELSTQGPLAVMSAEIVDAGDGWYQLLPAGEFSARDGRPFDVPGGKWLMDETAFSFIQASYDSNDQPIVVDYNHQTLNKDKTGSDAPAAGWIKGDGLMFRPGVGLFVRPAFTDKAQAHIAAREFCYLSAVFHYHADTGRPFELRMVALTNDPGVTGMQALAALSALTTQHIPEKSNVNEQLLQLLAGLGITVPKGTAPTAEHCAAALSAITTLQTAQQQNGELTTKVASLSAQLTQPGASVDLTKFVPVATYEAVRGQLAALSAEHGTLTLDKVLEDAHAKGRVLAAEEDYLRDFAAQQGVAALSAMLEKRPAIAALSAIQEIPDKSGKRTGTASLSAIDHEIMRLTGVSEADFLKTREQEQK